MPKAAAEPSVLDVCREMVALVARAAQFVAPARGLALIRKWVDRCDTENMPEERILAMQADAVLLAADLLLSQPSASGSTAFDRLAGSCPQASAAEAAARTALRRARFRLLRVDGRAAGGVLMRDVHSGEELQAVGPDVPPLDAGMMLFARVATLGDGLCCLPSAITPLDPAADALARGHVMAGAAGAAAGARWAEAVYAHVVRHGTLDVPGVNRPRLGLHADEAAEDDDLLALAMEWMAVGDGGPDAALLQRTREYATLADILDALCAGAITRDAREDDLAAAFEKLLLVQLETVLRRAGSGAGSLTIEVVRRAIDDAIAAGEAPPASGLLLARLHARLVGSSGDRRPDDPALERLLQRIQALRAKTVARGCTEQEALAAAEKVAELLDRYGLSLGELELRAQPCEGIGIETNRRRFAPIDTCVPAIAAFFECRVWVEHAKGTTLRYVFFGLRGDVAAAQYLYEMVERAFDTETAAFRAGEVYARMEGERRSASHSFQVGLATGIYSKLHELRSARDEHRRSASGRDLVPVKAAVVDEEVEKLGLDLHVRSVGRRRQVITDAYAEGEAAGQRFEYVPAVAAAA
jgi:Protein of unknown function (DUF2786)